MVSDFNCIVVVGPTASGKTHLACRLAFSLGGEIISADSRQVYRNLNIGTGKDLDEYVIDGKIITHHLIDITDPKEQYYLHDFIAGCKKAFNEIKRRGRIAIICGGTGLYLDSLRKDFSFTQIKPDEELRKRLEKLSREELLNELKIFPNELWQHADIKSQKRLTRAIEIASFLRKYPNRIKLSEPEYKPFYVGINLSAEERKKRIAERLKQRLKSGLVEEVQALLKKGINHQRLQELGLEYKFISLYLQNKLSYEDMEEKLRTAIFQFAKRQMTWFRKMEKEGVKIYWIKSEDDMAELINRLKIILQ